MDAAVAAREFDSLFRQLYLGLHRRDDKHLELSGAARGVLIHLSLAGPLTIGEAADHFNRSQSAVSEIIARLESKGWVERREDERDRRRTLVWLTTEGIEALRAQQTVLSETLVAEAMQRVSPGERAALIDHLRAFAKTTTERNTQ